MNTIESLKKEIQALEAQLEFKRRELNNEYKGAETESWDAANEMEEKINKALTIFFEDLKQYRLPGRSVCVETALGKALEKPVSIPLIFVEYDCHPPFDNLRDLILYIYEKGGDSVTVSRIYEKALSIYVN